MNVVLRITYRFLALIFTNGIWDLIVFLYLISTVKSQLMCGEWSLISLGRQGAHKVAS